MLASSVASSQPYHRLHTPPHLPPTPALLPQYEHTLYLHPTRKEVLSRGDDY